MPARVIPTPTSPPGKQFTKLKYSRCRCWEEHSYTIPDTECRGKEMQKEVQVGLAFLRKTSSSLPQFSSCGEQGWNNTQQKKGLHLPLPTVPRLLITEKSKLLCCLTPGQDGFTQMSLTVPGMLYFQKTSQKNHFLAH